MTRFLDNDYFDSHDDFNRNGAPTSPTATPMAPPPVANPPFTPLQGGYPMTTPPVMPFISDPHFTTALLQAQALASTTKRQDDEAQGTRMLCLAFCFGFWFLAGTIYVKLYTESDVPFLIAFGLGYLLSGSTLFVWHRVVEDQDEKRPNMYLRAGLGVLIFLTLIINIWRATKLDAFEDTPVWVPWVVGAALTIADVVISGALTMRHHAASLKAAVTHDFSGRGQGLYDQTKIARLSAFPPAIRHIINTINKLVQMKHARAVDSFDIALYDQRISHEQRWLDILKMASDTAD